LHEYTTILSYHYCYCYDVAGTTAPDQIKEKQLSIANRYKMPNDKQ